MAGVLGTIRGQMILDVKQAIAAYTAARLAHLQTVTALRTGGGAMMAAGAGIAAVGVGILAGLKMAADAAATFERKMDYAGAVTGATASQMDALRKSAIQLGQDTIFSAGQIADSFVELAKSGVSTSDIIGGIGQAVAMLGAAADIPLDTAANIIMSAVQTFGLSADQAVHVADLLAGAANASIVDVQDLGVSLKYVGGIASALSIPIESVSDALALLGTYGIKGSTAGTSLRQILVSLGGATKPARAELEKLGIITADGANKFFDANGSAKSLSEIFQVLQDATAGLSDEQKVAAFRTIFQNRALAAALDLTKSGAAGFAAMHAEIGKTTAMDVANARLNNLSGDMEILRGNIETLVITEGSTMQNFLRGLVQGVTGAVQWFTNLSTGTQDFLIKGLAISGVVFAIIGIFGLFAGSIMQIVGLAIQLNDAWKLFKETQMAITVAQWAQNAAFLASPITWIVLAVIALIAVFVLLWKNNKGFRDFFIGLWAGIVTAFNAVVTFFKGIPAWWNGLWAKVGQIVSDAWAAIQAFFVKWGPWMLAALGGPIGLLIKLIIDHWTQIKAFTVSVWTSILTFFSELPGKIGNFFAALPNLIMYWIGFAIGYMIRMLIDGWNLVVVGWGVLTQFFANLPGVIGAFFSDMYTRVITWLAQMVIDAAVWIYNMGINMMTFFSELPGKVGAFFSTLYNNVVNWLGRTAISAATTAQTLYSQVVNWISQLPGRIGQFFVDIYNWIVNTFNSAKNQAISIGTSIFTGIRDAINGLPGLVSGIFQSVIQAIKDKVTAAFNAVKGLANSLWEGFKDGLGIHSPSYIERAMWQITGVVADESANLAKQVGVLQGLGNNIVDTGSMIGNGFNLGLDTGLQSLQNELARAKTYQNQLVSLASTSTMSLTNTATNGTNNASPVIIKAGDTNTVDVTWNAAPNDTISTRQQAKSLLGKAASVLDTTGAN